MKFWQLVVTADGALVGIELQSQTAMGKYECRLVYMSVLEWGTWSLYLWHLELRFLGLSRPATGFTSMPDRSWFCTLCRSCLMFSWTAGFVAGTETPGLRHLRWGWGHEGCGGLILVTPSPMWTSDVDDRGPIPQMPTHNSSTGRTRFS